MSQSSRRFCSRKISGWFSMRFANIITQRLMTSLDFSGAAIAFPTRSETTGQKYCRQDFVKPLDCLPSRQICSQDRAGGGSNSLVYFAEYPLLDDLRGGLSDYFALFEDEERT